MLDWLVVLFRRKGPLLLLILILLGAITTIVVGGVWSGSVPRSTEDRQLDDAITGFRLLKNNYVDPLNPATLLMSGWAGGEDAVYAVTGVRDQTGPDVKDAPGDETRFRNALKRLLDESRGAMTADKLAQAVIAAMARSVRDDHTEFIPPDVWQRIRAGQTVGPGYDAVPIGEGSLVWEVLPRSSAEMAGLQPGDVIATSKDGQIPGPADAWPKSLSVQHADTSINISLGDEPVPFPFIDAERVDANVGYVRIRSFLSNEDTFQKDAQVMALGLEFFQPVPPAAWIVDLRNNGGGSNGLAAYVAARLGLQTPFDEIVMAGKNVLVADHSESLTGQSPIVILVNQYTASAAEVLAAAFQDEHRAYVIGEKTQGAVNASDQFEVAGGALSITTGRVLVGHDRRNLDKIGLTPDKIVPLTVESVRQARILGIQRRLLSSQNTTGPSRAGYDSQVQAALDYLRPLITK